MTDTAYADRLNKVNASLKLTNIRGKEYAEVNQRVLAFWGLFPDGRLETEFLVLDDAQAVCVARAYDTRDPEAPPISTGHAQEWRSTSQINKTSYVENCETSALGRCLGALGIGATTALATAEEVSNAIAQQAAGAKYTVGPDAARKNGRRRRADAASGPSDSAPATESPEALKAAKSRLWDACKALALATGNRAEDVAAEVNRQTGKKETAVWYEGAAAKVEELARNAGVKYEEAN